MKNAGKVLVKDNEKGSAIVIALLVLALMSVFVALAMSRSSAEAMAVGNETAESRTFYAAQGSLEAMTRNFNKIFERRMNPTAAELTAVRTTLPVGIPGYTFTQEDPFQVSTRQIIPVPAGPYAGLNSIRDAWRLRTTVTDNNTGTQIQLTRNIFNNRIPIFQFGVFYEDDLELFNGPKFAFGGRVHSNRHFFLHPSSNGADFDSRVTAVGHIVTQTKRNGDTVNITSAMTRIKNASGAYVQLLPDRGSVLNGTPNVFTADPQLPSSRLNTNWAAHSAPFDGNLQSQVPLLRLPLNIGNNSDLIELIKRGKTAPAAPAGGDLNRNNTTGVVEPVTTGATGTEDSAIVRSERFYNKTGLRISLADSQAKLPGCASGVAQTPITVTPPARCGLRLDGDIAGRGPVPIAPSPTPTPVNERARGYQPKPMRSLVGGAFDYFPTRVNGERLHTGGTREVWIKVETVRTDSVTGNVITVDVTEDFLSLGVTEQPSLASGLNIQTGAYEENPIGASITATGSQSPAGGTDSRSIIKLQRWVIPGPNIPVGASPALTSYGTAPNTFNIVRRYTAVGASDVNILGGCSSGCTADDIDPNFWSNERLGHLKRADYAGNTNVAVVPFPIKMFDTREGFYYDTRSTTYYTSLTQLPRNGVMSLVDIDVANLRRFFRGDFNGLFPVDTPFAASKGGVGMVSGDIPQDQGWVLYVSDRRGDANFDGEFDMEDVYGAAPGNDGAIQPGEDLDGPGRFGNGILDAAYGSEAERYNTNTVTPDLAAVNDHMYFRRGVRLINGQTLPGGYDSATPANTRGFTLATENGVYVKGNYNATGVATVPATGNTPFSDYLPFNTALHIPASVVADAVTILSNNWNDAASFSSAVTTPYNQTLRPATTTTMRFAMIAGDTITSFTATPNQGGGDPRLNGGVHNFKRFLEDWGGDRLDYTGSLINLYNSRNSNGTFKCCNTVYSPPTRNWVFDATFLDPNRIPPGTPFFQYVQTTGFLRTNN
ncbi:MAG: hypothetical protein ACKVQW_13870 [Pyrinomonadaceae bacterium]